MRSRQTVEDSRDAIPGLNYHELIMELFRTIDDAASRIAMAVDDAPTPIVTAINDMEARLETMEDELRRINSALKEMGPI